MLETLTKSLKRRLPPSRISAVRIKTSKLPADFDPEYYLYCHWDVRAAGMSPEQHYLLYGRQEERSYRPHPACDVSSLKVPLKDTRPGLLLITHNGLQSHCTLSAVNIALELKTKYRVSLVFLRGGPIAEWMKHYPDLEVFTLDRELHHQFDKEYFFRRLIRARNFHFALANSIETSDILRETAARGLPTLLLIHEFASSYSLNYFTQYTKFADVTVFSNETTLADALRREPAFGTRMSPIVPQGLNELVISPRDKNPELSARVRKNISDPDCVVLVGVGTATHRNTVDLFLFVYLASLFKQESRRFYFLWVGDTQSNVRYSQYLEEQVQRLGLTGQIEFTDQGDDLRHLWPQVDGLLIVSQEEPSPNICLEAYQSNVPVFYLDESSGFNRLLKERELADTFIAPHIDLSIFAEKIRRYYEIECSTKSTEISGLFHFTRENLSRKAYSDNLESLAKATSLKVDSRRKEALQLAKRSELDWDLGIDPFLPPVSKEECLLQYLLESRSAAHFRKLIPGFHPGIYEAHHAEHLGETNPLLHYLESDKPQGPWNHALIEPTNTPLAKEKIPRMALHLHLYYPELIDAILSAICANRIQPDLFITYSKPGIEPTIQTALLNYQGKIISVEKVPNRGRDLGALFTQLSDLKDSDYDLIGHAHTKKSPHLAQAAGDGWFSHCLEHVLGGRNPLIDTIARAFLEDSKLGMVFPEAPFILSWLGNYSGQESLCKGLGIPPPGRHILFPVGSMFWARRECLIPFWNLKLGWDDYPDEPVPGDGTLLHALERLLPLAGIEKGYRISTTLVRGVRW